MKEFRNLFVLADQSLKEAMLVIDRSGKGIALVVDKNEKLLGTLTDGDLRRAVLRGGSLDSPIEPYMQRNFKKAGPEASRSEMLDLMQAMSLKQVPIVDETGKLLGLHLLQELLGKVERPNWAVILAGGKGTRLRPITEHLPKPMIKVAGRPILERLLLHLVGYGFKRVFISLNYLGYMIEDYFGTGEQFGCRIDYLREKEPLGTAGPLSLLPERPEHPLLVINGDLVTEINVDHFLNFHEQGPFAATIGVHRYSHQVPFGCLEVDKTGRVSSLEEKPILEKTINAGIYVLSPSAVARTPKQFYLMTDLIEDCLSRGEPVGAFHIEEDWIDVGQPTQLKQAQFGVS